MVLVFIALAVGEGEAVVPLGFIVPAYALVPAVVCVWALEALFGWKRSAGVVPLGALTSGFSLDHG